MSNNSLPIEVVETDHALEKTAERASEALAKHRWHWTLDETNPWRTGISVYARAIGRSEAIIRRYARGYADWVSGSRTDGTRSLAECLERALLSELQQRAVEAVAEAQGVSYGNARRHHADDVRRVRDAVEDAEERRPDITPDEKRDVAKRTATNIVKSRQVEREGRERLRERQGAQSILIEGELAKAHYGLLGALKYAREVDPAILSVEFLDQIQRSLDRIDTLTQFLRVAIGGAADIDWDAELQKMEVA